ncbi:hypothetical protein BJY01DRAFT_96783 [Aspergillus pseudoustus]|uniref:Uncharacterized protein n=1 Tax=Aspergillus pseudoustus TaxID=1810923 RepID=A0ABR4KJK6_9EURO
MVVFIDYDHDTPGKHGFSKGLDAFQPQHSYTEPGKPGFSKLSVGFDITSVPASEAPSTEESSETPGTSDEDEPHIANRNGFSAALSCYPIAKELARSIDLITLQSLSLTCRQIYANLAPYRQQLAKQTLRCENEYIETLSDMLHSGTAIPDSVKSVIRLLSRGAMSSGQLTSGKVAKCARDMVAECRGCSKIVCRNCTAKPPNSATLKNRIRRLCTTCRKAPLDKLVSSYLAPLSSSLSDSNTSAVAVRDTCTCQDVLWLCNQCGQKLRRNDTTYRRVWTWRTRYSTYLGGLGTGIGEGCQGVKCGRGENCLAAQEIELEVECEADESMANSPPEYGYHFGHRFEQAHAGSHNHNNGKWEDPEGEETGYLRQEIIGIGGRMKQITKKRVNVGACVAEHEDERETGEYLTREEEGAHRSWCGWCWRVIPAKHEMAFEPFV